MKKHNIYIYIKKLALGLLPISLVATSAIALSSCASTDSSESTNTNSVDQAFLTNQFANFKSLSEIEEYKKNITGKYFDLTKELLVKSGYCTKEDGITSPSIIYSKNQDSNKLKIDFVFDILRENQNERVEINNILTSVNLIKIKELPLIHELSLRPLTADKLTTLTNDKLLETLKSINCGIDNPELITDSSVTLINNKNQFPIVASRDATPLTGFEIKLSLTCNENSIFMVENQISTLSNNFTKVIKNVKLSNEDKIAQSMWTFEDPTTKTIINGLSDFGKTQSRLIIPSNVSGIRKILLNKETNEIVKEIQFNKGSKLANIYNNAFEGFVGLDSINLPSSLKSIGTATFKGCSKLTKIKIDNNIDNDLSSLAIAEVPESCFEGCSLINNLKFAQDIKAPQAKAFKDCTSLNSITIGKNEKNDFTNCDWTRINESVFENTGELTIKFPQYLNSIGRRAFAKSKIKTFKLDQSKILNDDQKLKLIEDESFYECQSLLKNNSVFTKESDFGFTSTCIELFGNRAFAYTSISFFSDYIYYINSNTALGRYYDIFFNSKKIVNFGTSVFENSFRPPYDFFPNYVNNVYVSIYPNWKFNGKNNFKNTECSIWMNTVQLDGFSWTKDNYALDCFGQLNTVTSNVCLQGWNGILTWNDPNQNNSKTFDVKKFPANAKEILSKIYPPNLYKPGVNNFKYSYATNSNIMFDWKKS